VSVRGGGTLFDELLEVEEFEEDEELEEFEGVEELEEFEGVEELEEFEEDEELEEDEFKVVELTADDVVRRSVELDELEMVTLEVFRVVVRQDVLDPAMTEKGPE